MIPSDYLSILAVAISGISLYISWRQYSRDRSHLKLGLKVQEDIRNGPTFIISVVNVGRRPTTIVRGYALVSSGKRYPVFDTPTVLEETKTLEFSVPFAGFEKTFSFPYIIKAFEIEESTGKRSSIKTRHLKNQIKKYVPASDSLIDED